MSTLLAFVYGPGGEIRIGRYLYFTTGDIIPVTSNGTIERYDLLTGSHSTRAKGLTMPNGLAFLPNGDAVVTRDVGTGTGLTLGRASDRSHPDIEWARVDDTNGVAVDPSGRWLYIDRTFSAEGEVDRVEIAEPNVVQVVGHLGAGSASDDMTVDASGILYIAGFGNGKIYRLDPRSHASCAIASGLALPTAAVFGGTGWRASALYITGASGQLWDLTPPRRG